MPVHQLYDLLQLHRARQRHQANRCRLLPMPAEMVDTALAGLQAVVVCCARLQEVCHSCMPVLQALMACYQAQLWWSCNLLQNAANAPNHSHPSFMPDFQALVARRQCQQAQQWQHCNYCSLMLVPQHIHIPTVILVFRL